MQKFNQIRRQFFKKINTTNKFLARLMKKGKTQTKVWPFHDTQREVHTTLSWVSVII